MFVDDGGNVLFALEGSQKVFCEEEGKIRLF